MNELAVVDKGADWRRLKALVLDSVSSPITKRVYNLGLDEFFAWYSQEPRPGFTKATVAAWRVALEARGLGAVSINVRITAVRKLAVEAADNGLLAPELANGITRVKGVASKGERLGNWLTAKQAQSLLNATTAVTGSAMTEIVKEITRLRQEAPGVDELQGIKNYMAGNFVIQNSSRQGLIEQLRFVDLQGLQPDWLRDYVPNLLKVTPNDVQRIAESYLDPDKMALVVVGDKTKTEDQLNPFTLDKRVSHH